MRSADPETAADIWKQSDLSAEVDVCLIASLRLSEFFFPELSVLQLAISST
jgi:hypothetical protein